MVCGRFYLGLEAAGEIEELRRSVFLQEQGIEAFGELDEIDEVAVHVVAYSDIDRTCPVAAGRLYLEEGTGEYRIGRICVDRRERGKKYGDFVVRMLIDRAFQMGATRVLVGSQEHAIGFYEKIGFQRTKESYVEAFVTHVVMELRPNNVCKECQRK